MNEDPNKFPTIFLEEKVPEEQTIPIEPAKTEENEEKPNASQNIIQYQKSPLNFQEEKIQEKPKEELSEKKDRSNG
jgi:hypothetical protein